jgi:hypothetical protein
MSCMSYMGLIFAGSPTPLKRGVNENGSRLFKSYRREPDVTYVTM